LRIDDRQTVTKNKEALSFASPLGMSFGECLSFLSSSCAKSGLLYGLHAALAVELMACTLTLLIPHIGGTPTKRHDAPNAHDLTPTRTRDASQLRTGGVK
jgi:hypothetical protein